MIDKTLIGNHSKYSGIIVSEPVMISLLPGISYLRGWVVNWFVNVRCSEMIKNTDVWSWKVCLGLILEDREEGNWIWFSSLFGLLYLKWVYVCIAFANLKRNFKILRNGLIAEIHSLADVWVAFANAIE